MILDHVQAFKLRCRECNPDHFVGPDDGAGRKASSGLSQSHIREYNHIEENEDDHSGITEIPSSSEQ